MLARSFHERTLVLAFSLLAAIGATGLASRASVSSQPQGTTKTDGIKVVVSCDAGQIDQRHRVTITVCCPSEDPAGPCVEKTIVQNVPAQWHVNDIAVGIASKLNLACDLPPGTIWPKPDGTGGANLDVPPGMKIKEIKTEKKVGTKWKERKGHLKVSSYSKTSSGGLVLGAPAQGFSEIVLRVPDGTLNPPAVVLELLVDDGSGPMIPAVYEFTLPSGAGGNEALLALESIFDDYGMLAEMSDMGTLVVTPTPLVAVHYVSFGMYEDNDHEDIDDPRAETPPWDVTIALETKL